jgi:hypothetical protein
MLYHFGADLFTKFFHLLSDVSHKGITGPPAYEHDCKKNGTPTRYIAIAAPLLAE